MPDADGKIRGIAVPAEAWERIFGNDAEPPLFSRQPEFDTIIPPLEPEDTRCSDCPTLTGDRSRRCCEWGYVGGES